MGGAGSATGVRGVAEVRESGRSGPRAGLDRDAPRAHPIERPVPADVGRRGADGLARWLPPAGPALHGSRLSDYPPSPLLNAWSSTLAPSRRSPIPRLPAVKESHEVTRSSRSAALLVQCVRTQDAAGHDHRDRLHGRAVRRRSEGRHRERDGRTRSGQGAQFRGANSGRQNGVRLGFSSALVDGDAGHRRWDPVPDSVGWSCGSWSLGSVELERLDSVAAGVDEVKPLQRRHAKVSG